MKSSAPTIRRRRAGAPLCLGPVADLESHLPEEWWTQLFDAVYLMTDGDVVENETATCGEIDRLLAVVSLDPGMRILDLCCGQGRHALELARRGFSNITGIDRSRYLVRLARKRAAEAGLAVTFREGDARNLRLGEAAQDVVLIMGNSFGYFANEVDDEKVLKRVARTLRADGRLVLDLTDGAWIKAHYEPRSWEWIDQHHFVCRERSVTEDGDRLICREVVVHDDRGVLADQFYAERLYSRERIAALLERNGFRDIRFAGEMQGLSTRAQDLGMMAQRMLIIAKAPPKPARKAPVGRKGLEIAVALGDPRLPDPVKKGGKFNEEDLATVQKLKDALAGLDGLAFRYLDDHGSFQAALGGARTDLVFNLCDEGWRNDAFMELHITALLEMQGLPYTGAGPACLALCYDKALVRLAAQALDIPVPMETYVRSDDMSATLPSVFPALLKPNFGDSSVGITQDAVVRGPQELVAYLERLREDFGAKPVLVQEFLPGSEYTIGLIGNPRNGLRALPLLEVDYSGLPKGLPRILGYESKWLPDSPYWTDIHYRPASLPAERQAELVDHAGRLFERLGCRDYARFDFRTGADGTIKLLEANPNPGWCWDGKLNLMAEFAGMSYARLLDAILNAAIERLGLERPRPRGGARTRTPAVA